MNLEKIVFFEITNKQFGRFPNSEYLNLYNTLTKSEKEKFHKLSRKIHELWNLVNSKKIDSLNVSINSFEEYHEKIEPIDSILLTVLYDFNLDLKNQISEEFKNKVIQHFGKPFFDNNFEI